MRESADQIIGVCWHLTMGSLGYRHMPIPQTNKQTLQKIVILSILYSFNTGGQWSTWKRAFQTLQVKSRAWQRLKGSFRESHIVEKAWDLRVAAIRSRKKP